MAEGGAEILSFLEAGEFNVWDKGEKRTKAEEDDNADTDINADAPKNDLDGDDL